MSMVACCSENIELDIESNEPEVSWLV